MEEKGIKAIRGRRRETLTPRDATDGIDKNRNSQKRKKSQKGQEGFAGRAISTATLKAETRKDERTQAH